MNDVDPNDVDLPNVPREPDVDAPGSGVFAFTYNGAHIKVHPEDCKPGKTFRLPIGWPRDNEADFQLISRGVRIFEVEVEHFDNADCGLDGKCVKSSQVVLLFGPFIERPLFAEAVDLGPVQKCIDLNWRITDLKVEEFIGLMRHLQPAVSIGEFKRVDKIQFLSRSEFDKYRDGDRDEPSAFKGARTGIPNERPCS